MTLARVASWLCVALIAAWLLGLTLLPGSRPSAVQIVPFRDSTWAFACLLSDCALANQAGAFVRVQILGNVAVFMPLGAALSVALALGRRSKDRWSGWAAWLWPIAVGFAFSACIEAAQLFVPGRVTATDDVILNTLGAALGAWLARGIGAWLARLAETARRRRGLLAPPPGRATGSRGGGGRGAPPGGASQLKPRAGSLPTGPSPTDETGSVD